MNMEEYLQRLRASLKGFSKQEQEVLLAEITAHLAEGQADARLGADEASRAQRLELEMGSPEDLGRNWKKVHRPNRWLDFLLVFGPGKILFPLVMWLLMLQVGEISYEKLVPDWTVRTHVLMYVVMLAVSFWHSQRRGSHSVLLYWLPATWLTIFSQWFRAWRWQETVWGTGNIAIERLVEVVGLVILGVWLVSLLWRSRDALLVALALLPFVVTVGNMATSQLIVNGGFPQGYSLPDWRIGWYFSPVVVGEFLWAALFYLFPQRQIRWLGLLTFAIPLAAMNMVAAARYPHLIAVWALPLLLVLTGWMIDWVGWRRLKMV